jgi:hypothetical protein
MTKIGIAAVLLCCLLTAIASAGDSYICVADKATGFKYNKALDKWEIANFSVDDQKYIVRKTLDNDKLYPWEVHKTGDKYPMYCQYGFDKHGVFHCVRYTEFIMDKNNLRFIFIQPSGYYNPDRTEHEGDETPFMAIGKCSRLP